MSRRRSYSDVESAEEDEAPSTSARRAKRARAERSSPRAVGAPDLPNGNDTSQRGSPGGYQPGSIVRVKLENFVTYTSVEFRPGPTLNMVIGPNGTGKSTLVCAICIGLGWSPQYLGRAKEVSEFVKHGSQEATIEIELAKDGRRFKRNVVIRCTIRKEGNKTSYSVNGENKSKKATVELARSLSVQIDNLCQFLPQDKVVEFAAMTPVELLRSTQRAVADQDMIDRHDFLKDKRKNQKDLQRHIDNDQDILKNLESRQRLQEADVEKMREREEVIKRVAWLESARPFAEYREVHQAHKEATKRMKAVRKELDELRDSVEPSLRAVKQKDRYKRACVAVSDQRRAEVGKSQERADKLNNKYNGLVDRATEVNNEITNNASSARHHQGEIKRTKSVIDRLKRQMENPPPDVDAPAYNEKIRAKRRLMDEYEATARELKRQQNALNEQTRERRDRIDHATQELEHLASQAGKQDHILQTLSGQTFKLWKWIRENKSKFEQEVFGPPVVSCSIPDAKYVKMIEGLMQRNQLLSFTVQTRKDFKTLSDAGDFLRLSEVNIKTMTGDMNNFRPPAGEQEMARYGFESWAIDHVQGPEPVLAMLCSEVKLNETGVSPRDTTEAQFAALQRSNISSWVTNNIAYRITRRREYGDGATSTRTTDLKPARVWTDQPVDVTIRQDKEQRIASWEQEREEIKAEFQRLRVEVDKARDNYNKAKEEHDALTAEKIAKQKARGEFDTLPSKVTQSEDKVRASEGFLAEVKESIRGHTKSLDDLALQRAQLALQYVDAIEQIRVAHNQLYEAEIMSIEATSDFEVLTENNRQVNETLAAKEKEHEEVTKLANTSREKATQDLNRCKDLMLEFGEEQQEFVRETQNTSISELDDEIKGEKSRLELMHEGSGNVIRDFEQRAKKIEAATKKLDEFKAAKTELDEVISTAQSEWEPALDELIRKISEAFSYNMQQISCAGEVGVWKDEDFDQWAIQIKVKFRESESMTILDSHRQSGGERAVSTIFYLMSLQCLTRSPFRIVDEINQGMDPRNERLVHKRMVEIACNTGGDAASSVNVTSPSAANNPASTGGSQYFLITPKLLPGLAYARGMRVLCIASGEFVPQDQERIDFKACLDLARGLNAGRSVGVNDNGSNDGSAMPNHGTGRVGVAAG